MTRLLRFSGSVKHDQAIEAWMKAQTGELGVIARHWFGIMRKCGDDVRELVHDGHPTACIADAAFGYVNAFRAHVNVGFFRGAEIADPEGLLEGTGKFMRHVKLRPGRDFNAAALVKLVEIANTDMKERVQAESLRECSQGEKGRGDPGESGRVFGHRPLSQLSGGAREFAGGQPRTVGPND